MMKDADGPEPPAGSGDAVGALFDDAKRTIAEWCREADESARRIVADAESTRRRAHEEAERVREAARLEAGRILAEAEAQAGDIRARVRLQGAERAHQVEVLETRVEQLAGAIDYLLDTMDGVLRAVAMFSPGRPERPPLEIGEGAVRSPGTRPDPGR
jgi:vacuolar-type H+-ATPase subunit H